MFDEKYAKQRLDNKTNTVNPHTLKKNIKKNFFKDVNQGDLLF